MNAPRKYELLPGESGVRKLFRVRALRDFGDVRAGDTGGYIESEWNLSHDGDAWVYGNARVSGNARVYGNAQVCGDAQVYGNARVYGNAQVCGDAQVYGDARVYGYARVHGDARVYGYAHVYGNARVSGDAQVSGGAQVRDDTSICWFSHVGSESGTLTAFATERGIYCTRGCFVGTLDEFEAAVRETHGDSRIAREYALLIEFIRLRLGAA